MLESTKTSNLEWVGESNLEALSEGHGHGLTDLVNLNIRHGSDGETTDQGVGILGILLIKIHGGGIGIMKNPKKEDLALTLMNELTVSKAISGFAFA